jgi:hypothetical protein
VLNGVTQGRKAAPDDEEYALFTTGDFNDRQFRRIPKPSYSQRIAVEEIRIKATVVSDEVKEAICKELGWKEDKITDELSMMEYHEQILPLITRESLPGGWGIEDVSSYEAQRMLQDFLLGT